MFNKIRTELTVGNAYVRQNDFDNRAFTFELQETETSIKGILTAKAELKMKSLEIETDMAFDDNDLFFANGYQSWSTTREYDKNYYITQIAAL